MHMKWLMTSIITVSLLAAAPGAVMAHRGKLPEDALTLVRQASALLAQNPTMTGEVRERLEAALKSRKPQDVRLDQVAEALRALEKRDIAAARRLLTASMMPAGMPMPPEGPGRATLPSPASPSSAAPLGRPAAQPSGSQPVDVTLKLAEPLRVRFTASTAEIVILVVALGLIGLGLTSLWRALEAVRR